MTDVAALRSQLDALKAQRASGVRDVQFGERRAVYRSDKDIVAAIAALEAELAAASGTPKPRAILVRATKGFI